MDADRQRVLEATERAMARAAAAAHEDLKHGLNSLAMIAGAAPLVGILGTVFGLCFDTFLGFDGDKTTGMALVAGRISKACVPSAAGILIGIQAFLAYRYLRGRLGDFDGEMAATSLALINSLRSQMSRLRFSRPTRELGDPLPSLAAYAAEGENGRFRVFTSLATIALLLMPWSMQVATRLRSMEFDAMPLADVIVVSFWPPVTMFCCAYLFLYAVWVDLLHRSRRGIVAVAAALVVLWHLAGFVWPVLWVW